jgi:hypothetical protein
MLTIDLEYAFTRIDLILYKYNTVHADVGIYHRYYRFPINNTVELFYADTKELVDLSKDLKKDVGDIVDADYTVIATDKDIKNNIVSTKPFLSIYPAKLFKEFIDAIQFSLNPDRNLYYKDELGILNDYSILSIGEDIQYPEDVVDFNFLTNVEKKSIIEILYKIYNSGIEQYIESNPTHYFEVDVSTTICKIIDRGSLKAYLYELAVMEKKFLEREEDVNENG